MDLLIKKENSLSYETKIIIFCLIVQKTKQITVFIFECYILLTSFDVWCVFFVHGMHAKYAEETVRK